MSISLDDDGYTIKVKALSPLAITIIFKHRNLLKPYKIEESINNTETFKQLNVYEEINQFFREQIGVIMISLKQPLKNIRKPPP